MTTPLWSPTPARVRGTHLHRFTHEVADRHGIAPEYPALWRWSIEQPEAFWPEIWRYAGVIGEPGAEVVRDRDAMPGARYFPQGELNFAENLLRRRDDTRALVFRGEHGATREVSWNELYRETARWRAAE